MEMEIHNTGQKEIMSKKPIEPFKYAVVDTGGSVKSKHLTRPLAEYACGKRGNNHIVVRIDDQFLAREQEQK